MRTGLGISIAAHAAILVASVVGLPDTRPFEVDDIQALPVDLVDVSDVTDLKLGERTAKELPAETPQPKPQVQAEAPAPKPAEKPAEKPVEAAREPAARPEPSAPEPEPTPEPEPQEVASLPEPVAEPEPEPLPEPEAVEPAPAPPQPQAAPKPRARPTPPKQVEKPKPETPEPPKEVAKPAPTPPTPEEEFNPDDIAALLDKQDPAGGGDPNPSPEPQTIGSIDGTADAAMTQSEIDALKARLYQCWSPPVAVREAGNLRVTVSISLQPNGTLAAAPQVMGGGFDALWTVAADSAVRAVLQCAPFDILPPEKYASWREIEFTFDPREMLGG